MGVSGVGKTTVGRALATRAGWAFLEADDDHSPAAKAQMAKGIPLTDADRAPWLKRVRGRMTECIEQGESIVLACSALKRAYRDYLRGVPDRVVFVQLVAPREVLAQRLASRAEHFAGVSLLESQLDTQDAADDAVVIDATQNVDEIVNEIAASLDTAE